MLFDFHKKIRLFKDSSKPFNPLTYNDPNGSELVSFWYSKTAEATDTQVIDAMGDETRPVQPGRCYNFDGVDDFVQLSQAITLTGSFDISIGAKFASFSGTPAMYGGSAADNVIVNISGTLRFRIANVYHDVVGIALETDTSYTIRIVRDEADALTFFVDGVQYNTITGVSGAWSLLYVGTRNTSSQMMKGKLWDFQVLEGGNTLLHYKMDEAAGTTAFDSSGNNRHGTTTNATLSTFHATDIDIPYSWQNEVGYSDGTGAYAGVLIPRNEAIPTEGALGNPLQYQGRVKYNLDMAGSYCATFDGVDDFANLSAPVVLDLSKNFTIRYHAKITNVSASLNMVLGNGSTFVPYLGFHEPSSILFRTDANSTYTVSGVGANLYADNIFEYVKVGATLTVNVYSKTGVLLKSVSITVPTTGTITLSRVSGRVSDYRFAGSLSNMTIVQDGVTLLHLPMSEGAGTKIYDVSGNGNHGTAVNTTAVAFWGQTQDVYHQNLVEGYSDGVNLLKYSEQFDNAYWNEASANYDIATASFYPTITGAYRGMFATVGITLAEVRTITIKVKYKGFKFFCIIGPDGSGTQAGWFDIETGVLGSVVGSGFSHSIKTAEDGYYYCSLHCPAVVTAGYIQFMVTDVDNSFIATANGTNGVYIASAQYEKGSIFTTYQKTEDSPTAGALIPSFDSTTDVFGNTLTNPAGNFHNGAETKLRVPDAPALKKADNSSFLYTGSTPNDITYSDIVANTGDQIFADTSTSEKKNIMVYDQVLIDPALKKVEKFTNQ